MIQKHYRPQSTKQFFFKEEENKNKNKRLQVFLAFSFTTWKKKKAATTKKQCLEDTHTHTHTQRPPITTHPLKKGEKKEENEHTKHLQVFPISTGYKTEMP